MDRDSELGGLWLKTSNSGKKYMSGKFTINGETVEVVVFKNERKQPGERTPDYRVYKSQPRDGGGQQTQRQPVRGGATYSEDLSDEVPF